ncbi:hypothetical protein A9Q96_06530 [Rhodobacterales bacterium 52_120_T64]|nr:hypothetical protein A9Q96_06530 [Rhodobacterales bacterium 52_120_T64]
MTKNNKSVITRRQFAASVAAFSVAAPNILRAQEDLPARETVEIRTNNYSNRSWQEHFSSLRKGAILVDTQGRTLHYWPQGEAYHKVFPVSVPLTPDLTRLGRTSVTRKRVGPDWRPTPSMLKRNPDLPEYIGPGPENPLGTHALYLSWQYYRIHGTNDTRKIGRQSSNGCIGLYNDDIEELFGLAKVGTQVLLI